MVDRTPIAITAAGDTATTTTSIWDVLRERIDYASFVPRPLPDIERQDLADRGGPYTILRNPHGDGGAGSYLRLEPADVALYERMDGLRTVQEILIEQLLESGSFALDRMARLTAALATNAFFGEPRPRVYQRLFMRRAMRDPLRRLQILLRRLIVWNIASWANADGPVQAIYRAGGWLAFTRIGAAALIAFAAYGTFVWFQEFTTTPPHHSLFTVNGSYVQGIVALILLQVVSVSVHEAGHALAIVHFGRHVRRLGVAIYYLFPCFYVDSTDMSVAPRRQRVVVSLAGPIGGLVVGAACAVVAAAAPETFAGDIGFKAASLFIFQFVFNLLPILDLDGYHVLVDALDAPFLRPRAVAFVRGNLMPKIRRRQKWSRAEIGLAIYGSLAIVISFLMLISSLVLWEARLGVATGELFSQGPAGVVALALIALIFVGPLLVTLVARLWGIVRSITNLPAKRRRARERSVLAERVHVLARVPFLLGLTPQALAAIASHLEEERYETGDIVVTAGEPGDRFYVVRSGRVEAVAADGTALNAVVPGEGFGELSLLDGRPRSVTVRAAAPSVLWSLDRSQFNRWVRDRYEVAARVRASSEEREGLAKLPFFRDLKGTELDRIAARLRTRRVAAGEPVFRAGDPSDRYYVIREGTAQVSLPDGTAVRPLGPGEGFGELALLFGGPRTATVTAVTDLVLAGLARNDFALLVKASGETMREFRTRTGHYVGAGLGGAVAGGR